MISERENQQRFFEGNENALDRENKIEVALISHNSDGEAVNDDSDKKLQLDRDKEKNRKALEERKQNHKEKYDKKIMELKEKDIAVKKLKKKEKP